jgi:hypothetical protein
MHPSDESLTCLQELGANTTVELSVRRDDPAWRWEVRFGDGQTLDAGDATTRVAGQMAAQNAFERRVKRAGLLLRNFRGYRWASL